MDVRRWAMWQRWLALTGLLHLVVYGVILVLGGAIPEITWTRAVLRQVLVVAVLAIGAAAFLALIPLQYASSIRGSGSVSKCSGCNVTDIQGGTSGMSGNAFDFSFEEQDKVHTQVYANRAGLCPTCLDLYVTGRGGAKTPLVEEVVDGVKTGKWICPLGGPSYADQVQALDTNRSGWRFGVTPR